MMSFSVGTSLKDEDFEEEEVWGHMEKLGRSSVPKKKNPRTFSSSSRRVSNPSIRKPSTSAPLNIPQNNHMMLYGHGHGNGNGSSSWVALDHHAPVRYGDDDDGDGDGDGGYYHGHGHGDDDDDGEIVPPHEYIARRMARAQISSFSVCEGIGRKLKGRDLSEMRNQVLRNTGFLER